MAKHQAAHLEAVRTSGFLRRVSTFMLALLGMGLVAHPAEGDEPKASSYRIEAPALEGIAIDGDLKDWPVTVPRYPVRNILIFPPDHGYNGLKDADLSTSPDLSVAFSVGYSPAEQVLYLAVIVRDDKLVIGHETNVDGDAVEVCIDGRNSKRDLPFPSSTDNPWWEKWDLSTLPVHQYIAIPGEGRIFGTKYDTNPILMAGDLNRTKTQMAFRRQGDIITYEWAVQPFDKYPDEPTRLEPGKAIGFDLAIVDRDVPRKISEPEEDHAAWVYWGPQWNGMKACRSSTLGEIVLGKAGPQPKTTRSDEAGSRSRRSVAELRRESRPASGPASHLPRPSPPEDELRGLLRELEDLTAAHQALLQRTARATAKARRALESPTQ
jgi:hypothetical protein